MTAASLGTPDLRLQRIGRAERGRFILVSKFLLGLFPEFVFLACGPAMALPDLVSALLDFFFRRLGHRVHLPPYCFLHGDRRLASSEPAALIGMVLALRKAAMSAVRPRDQPASLCASSAHALCFLPEAPLLLP